MASTEAAHPATGGPVVLHVSQPTTAGVAAVVAQLVEDQHVRGWTVHVACPDGPLAERAAALGAIVHHWTAGRGPGPGVVGEVRRLQRVLRTVRPDVVHLHSSKAGLAGRLAVRGRIPTIFQPHLWSFQVASGAVGTASAVWERWAARWTDLVICVSDDEIAAGRAAGVHSALVVIPNGVDTDLLRPAERAAARDRLGLPDAPTVVCVGRVVEQKGQDLLLDAWPAVLDALPGARLVLVGDGPMEERLRAEPPAAGLPSVRWAGPTTTPAPWYHAADVVVLPSRAEGMALVPLEAMACGRAVVAFDVGGVQQSIGDGPTAAGTVVPSGDVDGLARALITRLTDPGATAAEGARGRARVLADFDRHRAAGRVAALVGQLIGEKDKLGSRR